ncbi:transmembrane protein 71 isoform X1 [Prionailurus iriomotensis]
MYRTSQLMSTPVVLQALRDDIPESRLPDAFSQDFACDFPDGDSSFEGCSAALLTGSHVTCRRSPRLLSNGYYVWTEDPFLCDKDGNITLSPPQASVLYKENLVRIFRKKKRIRPSFSNLFSLGASKSWQHGNIFGDVDSSLSEDTWLEGVGRLDTHHCNDIGDDRDGSVTDAREAEQRKAASSSSHAASRTPPENSHDLALQSQGTTSEHFPENLLDHARAGSSLRMGTVSQSSVDANLPTERLAQSRCSETGEPIRVIGIIAGFVIGLTPTIVTAGGFAVISTVALEHRNPLLIAEQNIIETSLWRDIFFQAFLLAACLIICACARCFLGGIFASVVTCPLVITTAYTVTSLFLSLADYFEATACAQTLKCTSASAEDRLALMFSFLGCDVALFRTGPTNEVYTKDFQPQSHFVTQRPTVTAWQMVCQNLPTM